MSMMMNLSFYFIILMYIVMLDVDFRKDNFCLIAAKWSISFLSKYFCIYKLLMLCVCGVSDPVKR